MLGYHLKIGEEYITCLSEIRFRYTLNNIFVNLNLQSQFFTLQILLITMCSIAHVQIINVLSPAVCAASFQDSCLGSLLSLSIILSLDILVPTNKCDHATVFFVSATALLLDSVTNFFPVLVITSHFPAWCISSMGVVFNCSWSISL